MSGAGGIREWRGHDVTGSDGHNTGTLEPVYGDTGADEPASGTVTAGLGPAHARVRAAGRGDRQPGLPEGHQAPGE